MIFGEIEGSKAGFNLMLEVSLILGGEMVFVGDATEEIRENSNFSRVLASADGEAFFGAALPILDVGLAHILE